MRQIIDHSPSQYEQHRDVTLFLSFDEWAELKGHPWIREATEAEVEDMRQERAFGDARVGGRDDAKDRADWESLFEDSTGRPYLPVTVLRSAPGHVWRQATGHLRLHRVSEEW